MIKLIIAALLSITAPVLGQAAPGSHELTIVADAGRVYVIDGDTIALPCVVPARGCAEKIRLLLIDTPEVFHPGCENELIVALKAKERLRQLLPSGVPLAVDRHGHDRFGRTLASVYIGDVDPGQVLVDEGLALPYRPGAAAKLERLQHWCGPDAHLAY